ncbi:hypothetical protein AQUCO_00200389v1 [Aquilegia coerulea]|uniref:Structural polyprotein n=1 Tax=Aquilegia coerulea TaxID=218851 RepID=A0A2G5F2V4_AQUCA|nr:hypothetical protein AQUCO_00200389v1 [Aquilegia coerulea]
MASSNLVPLILFFFFLTLVISLSQAFPISLPRIQRGEEVEVELIERRSLRSFKETPKGSNLTFKCSPSGPCVSCLYSEKNDDKYRCSETGYHIPLKCLEIKSGSKLKNDKKPQKERSTMEITHAETSPVLQDEKELITSVGHKRLLDDSSASEAEKQAYITYRSCIPAVFEEKLSVLGFEGIMFGLLLVSGPVVYIRRKRTIAMSGVGPVRVQTNSRF